MEKRCENCNNILNEGFEFCPYCSLPITKRAKEFEEKKAVNAELLLLATLIKEVQDPQTLYLLDKYVKILSKK